MFHRDVLSYSTPGRGTYDVTADVGRVVAESGLARGLCHVFCHHMSASLVQSENADPAVRSDLVAWLARAVPDGDRLFDHVQEGPDDMPAHVKAALTATSLAIPVTSGRLALGTWQGIFLWEHRRAAHSRKLLVHISGE